MRYVLHTLPRTERLSASYLTSCAWSMTYVSVQYPREEANRRVRPGPRQ